MNAARLIYLADVAQASGVAAKTLNQWIVRGLPVFGDNDVGGGGPGRPRLFSFDTTFQIAIAAELMRFGSDVPAALTTALRIVGTSGVQCFRATAAGDIFEVAWNDGREIGELWADGRSYYVATAAGGVMLHIPPGATVNPTKLCTAVYSVAEQAGDGESYAMIALNPIYRRVEGVFTARGL